MRVRRIREKLSACFVESSSSRENLQNTDLNVTVISKSIQFLLLGRDGFTFRTLDFPMSTAIWIDSSFDYDFVSIYIRLESLFSFVSKGHNHFRRAGCERSSPWGEIGREEDEETRSDRSAVKKWRRGEETDRRNTREGVGWARGRGDSRTAFSNKSPETLTSRSGRGFSSESDCDGC